MQIQKLKSILLLGSSDFKACHGSVYNFCKDKNIEIINRSHGASTISQVIYKIFDEPKIFENSDLIIVQTNDGDATYFYDAKTPTTDLEIAFQLLSKFGKKVIFVILPTQTQVNTTKLLAINNLIKQLCNYYNFNIIDFNNDLFVKENVIKLRGDGYHYYDEIWIEIFKNIIDNFDKIQNPRYDIQQRCKNLNFTLLKATELQGEKEIINKKEYFEQKDISVVMLRKDNALNFPKEFSNKFLHSIVINSLDSILPSTLKIKNLGNENEINVLMRYSAFMKNLSSLKKVNYDTILEYSSDTETNIDPVFPLEFKNSKATNFIGLESFLFVDSDLDFYFNYTYEELANNNVLINTDLDLTYFVPNFDFLTNLINSYNKKNDPNKFIPYKMEIAKLQDEIQKLEMLKSCDYNIYNKENHNDKIIGIVIPIYNVEQYLEQCILSILKQTKQNFQVLLINDGSLDSSYLIAKKYVDLDSRFILINKHNGGLSDARNTGIDIFSKVFNKNDYFYDDDLKIFNFNFKNLISIEINQTILNHAHELNTIIKDIDCLIFLDSDDCWHKEMLEYANSFLDSSAEVAYFNHIYAENDFDINKPNEKVYSANTYFKQFNFKEGSSSITTQEWIDKAIENKINRFSAGWNIIIRFNFLKQINLKFVYGIYYEDLIFGTMLFFHTNTLFIINKELYYYRQSKNSIMRQDNNNISIPSYLNSKLSLFKDKKDVKEYQQYRSNFLIGYILKNFLENQTDISKKNKFIQAFDATLDKRIEYVFKYFDNDNFADITMDLFKDLTICINEKSNINLLNYINKYQFDFIRKYTKFSTNSLNLIKNEKDFYENLFFNSLECISEDKTATQSSTSQWSIYNDKNKDASNALTYKGNSYAFHTAKEPFPWWKVDLKFSQKIKLIKICNRQDSNKQRSANLFIEISDDNKTWKKIPDKLYKWIDLNYFFCFFEKDTYTRFIKVSLNDTQYLHLAKIEIF